MATEALKWGWSVQCEDKAHGPFDTREDALANARRFLAARPDGWEIEVGRCEPAVIDDYLPGPEDVLEQINQHAYDNGFSWAEEGVFEFKEGAEDVFFSGLEMLVKEHIVSTGAWLLVDTEKVKLV